MGCDIHLFAEIKLNGKWNYFKEIDVGRDYELFARMANFGRCIDIKPLVPNKGKPDDLAELTIEMLDTADHSFSWFDCLEITKICEEFPNVPFGDFIWSKWGGSLSDMKSYNFTDVRWVFGFDN
jgi:hypothetical protein